jgi:hypothetical protein
VSSFCAFRAGRFFCVCFCAKADTIPTIKAKDISQTKDFLIISF